VTVLGIVALVNCVGTLALCVMMALRSDLLYVRTGYGPNRLAIADVFGPHAGYAALVLLCIGVLIGWVGYGLLTLRPWARRTLFVTLVSIALMTVVAMGWGVHYAEWGVVASGVPKIGLYLGLCWYLRRPTVSLAFEGGGGEGRTAEQ